MSELKTNQFNAIINELDISKNSSATKSALLNRLEKYNNENHSEHGEHSSHCQFDRDGGGGHGNVCWRNEDDLNIVGDSE